MPEFTLEDSRRLYMIYALFPTQSWEFKKFAYDLSANEYGSSHRSVTSLKSYWSLHRKLWNEAHVLRDPPSSISNDFLEAQGQRDQQNSSTTQDPGSLLGAQDQQHQHSTSISEHSDSYVDQRQVQQAIPVLDYPASYVGQALLKVQDPQDQQGASMAQLPVKSVAGSSQGDPFADNESQMYSQYPMHPASASHGPFFADTMYGIPHFPSSSSGWNLSHEGDQLASIGQQPVGAASYLPAGLHPNTYMACSPGIAFTPQTRQVQVTEPCYLEQIPEENLASHDASAEESVTPIESSEEDSDDNS